MAPTETRLMKTILMTVFLLFLWLAEVSWVTACSLSRAMAVRLKVEMYTEAP